MPNAVKPAPPPFTSILIGALCLHGEISAAEILTRGREMGLSINAQGRAIASLMRDGLISVDADGSGTFRTGAHFADLPQPRRIRGIVAHLGRAKAVAHV